CGQSGDVHVLSIREVAGDVTHSLLHLDSRVWRTVRLLVRRPGELTRELIAGRHQQYIPPFRLYLASSILYFALQTLLPDFDEAPAPEAQAAAQSAGEQAAEEIRKELKMEGIATPEAKAVVSTDCKVRIFGDGEGEFE